MVAGLRVNAGDSNHLLVLDIGDDIAERSAGESRTIVMTLNVLEVTLGLG